MRACPLIARLSLPGLLLVVSCLVMSFLVAGCAVSPPASTPISPAPPAAPAASNLAGNWLLNGAFPSTSGFSINSNAPGSSITFDVSGQTVTGAGSFHFQCTGGILVFGLIPNLITGTVKPDGTFTVTDSGPTAASPPTFTLSGTVPSAPGGSWTGTYTATIPPVVPPTTQVNCTAAQLTGTIAATPIADLTGSFSGAGIAAKLPPPGSLLGTQATSVPVSLSLKVQQGAPLSIGGTVSSRLGVSGSVAVTGIPCFSQGTVGTTISPGSLAIGGGVVQGDEALLPLTMNDGSTAQLLLEDLNATSSQLAATTLEVPSGNCAGSYLFLPSTLVLLKQ